MGLYDFSLAEGSVLVNVDLGVDTVNVQVWSHSPRIDFNLGGVHTNKHAVEFLELFNALITCLSRQIQIIDDLLSKALLQLWQQRETKCADGSRVLLCDRLNIHATLLGVDAAESLVLTIVQEGQIDLPVDVDCLVNEHRLDGEARGRGLVSDQIEANHAFGLLSDDLR